MKTLTYQPFTFDRVVEPLGFSRFKRDVILRPPIVKLKDWNYVETRPVIKRLQLDADFLLPIENVLKECRTLGVMMGYMAKHRVVDMDSASDEDKCLSNTRTLFSNPPQKFTFTNCEITIDSVRTNPFIPFQGGFERFEIRTKEGDLLRRPVIGFMQDFSSMFCMAMTGTWNMGIDANSQFLLHELPWFKQAYRGGMEIPQQKPSNLCYPKSDTFLVLPEGYGNPVYVRTFNNSIVRTVRDGKRVVSYTKNLPEPVDGILWSSSKTETIYESDAEDAQAEETTMTYLINDKVVMWASVDIENNLKIDSEVENKELPKGKMFALGLLIESGAFGYKVAKIPQSDRYCMVKLFIPENTKVAGNSEGGGKLRAQRAIVVTIVPVTIDNGQIIYDLETKVEKAISCVYSSHFEYPLNTQISVPNFNQDLGQVCVPGIHFYLRQEECYEHLPKANHCKVIGYEQLQNWTEFNCE